MRSTLSLTWRKTLSTSSTTSEIVGRACLLCAALCLLSVTMPAKAQNAPAKCYEYSPGAWTPVDSTNAQVLVQGADTLYTHRYGEICVVASQEYYRGQGTPLGDYVVVTDSLRIGWALYNNDAIQWHLWGEVSAPFYAIVDSLRRP